MSTWPTLSCVPSLLAACRRKADDIIDGIEQRLAQWARIPAINGEDTQVGPVGITALTFSIGALKPAHHDHKRDHHRTRMCLLACMLLGS